MDLSLSAIVSSLLFSTIGFYIFKEGKRRSEFRVIFVGLALMLFSYFTKGPLADWGVGIALCGLSYHLLK